MHFKQIPIELKWKSFVLSFVFYSGLYLLSNHFHLGEAFLLPVFWVDRLIPFIAWSIWIYSTHLFFMMAVVAFIKKKSVYSRFFYAAGLGSFISYLIFFFFPTTVGRTIPELNLTSHWLFQLIYFFDRPVNCFPSLHVFWVAIGLIPLFYEKPKGLFWMSLWGGAIILTTLTTKQHGLLDVVGGVVLAWFCWWGVDLKPTHH